MGKETSEAMVFWIQQISIFRYQKNHSPFYFAMFILDGFVDMVG
jgi:hypothetical protein